ncbi:hypothetical protein BDR05DRAFT_995320 [Suillus weaverae]|nr:hypothetical protein BDR05DRAFT_995320 [Suillus weaverae]
MHASHTRSRRKRGKIDDVEDDGPPLHVSRAEDTQSEAYSRSRPHSHQQTDSYVPFASRNSLAMSWEPPSFTDSPVFHSRPSDVLHRGGRDSYDPHDDDPPWSVRPKHDWNYQTGREWATNQGSSEQQNWGASTSYTDRGRGHGWQPDDRRGKDDRGDNYHHPNNDNNNHNHNRRRNNRKFQQRDNGWDTRRDRQPRTQDVQEEPPKDERSWEPGPGWQARGADQGSKHNRNRNNGNKNKNKKNQNKNRIRMEKERDKEREREQRRNDDDDDLNKYFVLYIVILSHSHIVLFTAGRDGSSIPYLPNLSAPPLLNRKRYPPDRRHLRGHDRARALLILTTLICLREVVRTQGPCLQDRSNIATVQFGDVVGRPLTGDELAGKPKAGSHIPLDHPTVVGPCVEGVDTAFRRPRL